MRCPHLNNYFLTNFLLQVKMWLLDVILLKSIHGISVVWYKLPLMSLLKRYSLHSSWIRMNVSGGIMLMNDDGLWLEATSPPQLPPCRPYFLLIHSLLNSHIKDIFLWNIRVTFREMSEFSLLACQNVANYHIKL